MALPKAPLYDAGGAQPQPAVGTFAIDATTGLPVSDSTANPTTFVAVTPNDATLLTGFQWLRVTTGGNLVLKSANNVDAVMTVPVLANEWIPFRSGYVMATNTTATGILGFKD